MKSVKILSLTEAGKKAKRHPTTLRKAISLGMLAAHRVSDAPQSHWRVKLPDLEKFLKEYPVGTLIPGTGRHSEPDREAEVEAVPTNGATELPAMVALRLNGTLLGEARAAARGLNTGLTELVEAAVATYLEGLR